MKETTVRAASHILVVLALVIVRSAFCQNAKTYKHASEYQIAILDENLRVATGSDVTLAKNTTDAKLGPGGQGIHLLHTNAGDYRVEAPVNKGMTILSALGSNAYHPANTFHNKWFLDNVQPGTKVLFASKCASPSKKHPNDSVRCVFYFPDPDSSDHEYETIGDFTPFINGDGSNAAKTAGVLCNTGKLKPEVEAELCLPQQPIPAPAPPSATAASKPSPMATPAVAYKKNQRLLIAAAPPSRPAPAPVAAESLSASPATPVPPAARADEVGTAGPPLNPSAMLSVVVDSNIQGADIEVDGQFEANTPSTITLSPGQHMIEVKKNGYSTWSRSLTLSGNGVHLNADLVAQAKRTTTRAPQSHSLQIQCYPATACGNR